MPFSKNNLGIEPKQAHNFLKKKPVFVGQYGATLHVRLKPQCKFYKRTGGIHIALGEGYSFQGSPPMKNMPL